MPSPVCVPCAREMKLLEIGVVVEFRAETLGDKPYQQFHGDLFWCERCGHHTVARYADAPSWEHHRPERRPEPHVSVPERASVVAHPERYRG